MLLEPWPWYISGPLLSLVMFLLLYAGKQFGVSSNLRTICSISGADRFSDFFKFDTKAQYWNLAFAFGGILGGFIAVNFLSNDGAIALSESSISNLQSYGFENIGSRFLPTELFGTEMLKSWEGLLILLTGGFLVGFGTRYAGGCTSGHAISGLSNLQIPSLIAVIGFFIGGLVCTHLFLPSLFNWILG